MLESESVEYQYSRDYSYVEQRLARGEERKYGAPEKKKWSELKHKKLTLFSLTGFWWTLCHFATFRFRKHS